MKIITKGIIPIEIPPWWTVPKIKCEKCSTVFQLEFERDIVSHGSTREFFSQRWIKAKCPLCENIVAYSEIIPKIKP